MGRIIAEKVRGMNWTAKISLVLIFTLVFSTFMHQGLHRPGLAQATTQTYTSTTTWTAPAGVTSVTVECWAGGGGGGAANSTWSTTGGGGGGAGGQYVKKTVSVTPGNNYTVTVGAGGTGGATSGANGGAGNDSWFSTTGTVIAKGGAGGTGCTAAGSNNAGGTGSTSGGIGDFVYEGGDGSSSATNTASGAGGGGAGSTGEGGDASGTTAGTGKTVGGGNGGAGRTTSGAGNAGLTYGGGGGGGLKTASGSTLYAGGSGAAGQIVLTYTAGDQVNVTDGTDPANYTVYAGETGKVADGFAMATNANTAEVTAVTASLTNSSNVSGIRLYRDAGTTGVYDSGVDTLLSTGTPGATVSFTGLTENLTTTPSNYLIVVDIASGATQGQTVVATVTGLTVTTPDAQGTVTDSGTTLTIGTPVVTVSGLADYSAPASVQQGQNNVAMMKFSLATNAGSVTWTGGTLDKIGTNAQLGAVVYDIYYDANGNGIFEPASDTIILTADVFTLATADPYTLTASQTITTTPKTYFIVYDVTVSATTTTTVGAQIAGNGYFTVSGGTVAGVVSTSSGTPTINAGTCMRSAPTVSMGGNGTVAPGGSKVYTVTVTNNDNSFCSSSTFTLSRASETGNTGSFTLPSALAPTTTGSLAPGVVYNSTTLTVIAQGGATIGHALATTVDATDAANHAAQTGSGAVTTTVVIPWSNNPLLHNSTNLGSTKWGANGWGIPGGKYGAFTCETCHTKTTTNIKRIKGTITVPEESIPGSTVNFQTITTPNGFGDNNLTHATSQRICELCHTLTTYHKYNQTAINHEMPNGNNDCTYCHPHYQGFKAIGCTDCHAQQQGSRAAVIGQFSSNSHHIQGVALTNQHCYQCHWEAKSDGSVNGAYHGGWVASGSAVDLVIYGAGARPTTYTLGSTAVAYTANGTRAELLKINQVCLGCHDDDTATAQPFGDGKTPKQYAWDGSSIGTRYSQSGTTTWGKYTTFANAAQKNITKAYSAHGNATNNARGWNTTTGVDGAITNTAAGAYNILCFDCHNSHGSSVAGTTTTYTSATTNGAILKDTTSGVGGYSVTYKPVAGGAPADKNVRNAGASICFDCHLNATATTTPWGYTATFGATQAIVGYLEKPYWYGAAGVNPSGAQQRFAYKNKIASSGGHFGASTALSTTPMGTIGGLCTPCHDPHGVTDNTSKIAAANKQYAVPLLKGTWMTSPYKEDAAVSAKNDTRGRDNKDGNSIAYQGASDTDNTVGYHIDQNTFQTTTTASPDMFRWGGTATTSNWPSNTAGTRITEDETQFAGICMQCHAKNDINPNTGTTWKTMDRIHNTVKGWGGTGGNAGNAIHSFTCSKCHTPHNSCLPRLMVSNCLDINHRGRVGQNGYVVGNAQGNGSGSKGSGRGQFPGGGGGTGDQRDMRYIFGRANSDGRVTTCHETPNATDTNHYKQRWNTKTPWTAP